MPLELALRFMVMSLQGDLLVISRDDLRQSLSLHPSSSLAAVLRAADLEAEDHEAPEHLAERLTDMLWWSWCTPLGYAMRDVALETIIHDVRRRMKPHLPEVDGDTFAQLQDLAAHFGVEKFGARGRTWTAEEHERLRRRMRRPLALAAAGGASFAEGAAGRQVLHLLSGRVGQVLPWLPHVGPVVRGVSRGAAFTAAVGTPGALALSALAVNSALGSNYPRVLALLLGIAALGPSPIEDACEAPSG